MRPPLEFGQGHQTVVSVNRKRVKVTGHMSTKEDATHADARLVVIQSLNAFLAAAIGTYNFEGYPKNARTVLAIRLSSKAASHFVLEGARLSWAAKNIDQMVTKVLRVYEGHLKAPGRLFDGRIVAEVEIFSLL
ncbi:hypothetical protein AAVH_18086 [Aphelenchoides avenae]|nr:hypothetical protein AAVH_18086 [Aphelenchus avenae]